MERWLSPGWIQTSKTTAASLSLNFARVDDGQGGNYTCTLSNGAGSDSVTYAVDVRPSRSNGVVPVPPSPSLASSTSSSLVCLLSFAFLVKSCLFSQVISWPPHPDGGAPVSSYTLFYRREFGSWQRREVDSTIHYPASSKMFTCLHQSIYKTKA